MRERRRKNQQQQKAKWVNIGTLRSKEEKDGEKKYRLVLSKNVEILVDGEPVDLGQYRTLQLFDAYDSLDRLVKNGKLDPDDAEKQMDKMEEIGIEYNIVVPPNDN